MERGWARVFSLVVVACVAACATEPGGAPDGSVSDGGDGGDAGADAAAPTLPEDRLVFDSNRTGNFEIFSMRLDGTDVLQLTDDAAYRSWWPRVSADRRRILFYRAPTPSDEDYAKAALWVMNADGSEAREIRPAGTDGWSLQAHAEWSPDGQSIAMCGTAGGVVHIFVTDADGSHAAQLTTDGGWNCDPSWSPDGNTIVFNRCTVDGCGLDPANLDIYRMDASGGTPQPLTRPDGLADYDPYFDPDGSRIAWLVRTNAAANEVLGTPLGAWGIGMMDANGDNRRYVVNDGQINSKPGWALDGSRIYFHRMEPMTALRFRIFRVDPDEPDPASPTLTEVDPTAPGNNEYPTN